MSAITTVIEIGYQTSITVRTDHESLVILEIDIDGEVSGIGIDAETTDSLIRALAAARVEIQPPKTPERPVRNPRHPNVPDNADALARVAKSKPERIDGDEK